MHKNIGFALIASIALFIGGCGDKASPKSTTTTRTQTSTEQDSGDKATSDVTVKTVDQADGSQDVIRTETTKQTTPPPTTTTP